MNAVLLSLAAFLSTSLGGLCALRLRDHLHLALGFSAGALLGVVCFDLLPEIFRLSNQHGDAACEAAMLALAGGFLLVHAIEKFVLVHRGQEVSYVPHDHAGGGALSAMALIGHSFVDGAGMGLAFQVSPAI